MKEQIGIQTGPLRLRIMQPIWKDILKIEISQYQHQHTLHHQGMFYVPNNSLNKDLRHVCPVCCSKYQGEKSY